MELAEKLKTIKINSNDSVYDHVNRIIQKMIENGEEDPYGEFEKYSEYFTRKNPKTEKKQNYILDNPLETKTEILELRKFLKIEKVLKKSKTENEEEEEEIEEESEPINLGEIHNLKIEEKTSKHCGVTIGEEETYYLEKSIENFIKTTGATKVDFWGKIFTSSSDYFILKVKVEAKEEEEEEELKEDHEPEGTGINKNIFYVSTNLLNPKKWLKLPLITSKQMRQAREMKYIFSGDLDKKIVSSPVFDGLEKHMLKAQVVRIDNGTTLIPSGEFIVKKEDEEEEIDLTAFVEIEKEEEPKKKKLDFFWNLKNWVHFAPSVLKQGRIVHQELIYAEDDETEDEEREKIKKYAVSLDPYETRLKSISQDFCEGLEKCWDFKFFGEKSVGKHPFLEKSISDTVFMMKSFVWPGFYLFCKNGEYFSRYFGYGIKYSKEEFFPKYEYFIETEEKEMELSEEICKPVVEEEEEEEKE